MSRLAWNTAGTRLFESGVDRGVLYTTNNVGIAWNGLVSVKESGSGGDARPFFLDGQKYLNISTREDFAGTIEAFTYPDEFSIHDGSFILSTGLIAQQQRRRSFGFSYCTRIGDDLSGTSRGYKLHIVYDALAEPSDKSYMSLGSNVEPMNFSWAFSTKAKSPKSINKLAPMAHVIIDSTKTNPTLMRYIEEQLYGSESQQARLIPIDELFAVFEKTRLVYSVVYRPYTGLNPLNVETDYTGDLYGDQETGYYTIISNSRMTPYKTPGFYTLGVTEDPSGVTPDPNDEGYFIIGNGTFMEDPNDPGFFIGDYTTLKEDPNDPGTFVPYYYTPVDVPVLPGLIDNPNEAGTYLIIGNALLENALESGVYTINATTIVENPAEYGIYVLYSSDALMNSKTLVADVQDAGTYVIMGGAFVENTNDPGTYTISSSTVYEDTNDRGTYLY